MITFKAVCPFCQSTREVQVPEEGFEKWKAGELIQRAMPELSDSDREAVMTGICDTCFPSDGSENMA